MTGRITRQSAGGKPYTNSHHRLVGHDITHCRIHRLAERARVQHDPLDALAAAPLVHRLHQAPPQALLAVRGFGVDVEDEPAARIHAERSRRPRDHDQPAAGDDRAIRCRGHPAAIRAVGNRGREPRGRSLCHGVEVGGDPHVAKHPITVLHEVWNVGHGGRAKAVSHHTLKAPLPEPSAESATCDGRMAQFLRLGDRPARVLAEICVARR